MTLEHVKKAEAILGEIRHMRASQCRNCGMVFRNRYGTHDERRFRRSRCLYDPVGWENNDDVE